MLDRRVEVELPRLVELRDRFSRERLGDTADAELRRGRCGLPGLQVCIAESLRPNDLPIHCDCQREARDVRRKLLARDGVRARPSGIPPVINRRPFGRPRNTCGLLNGEKDEHSEGHEL